MGNVRKDGNAGNHGENVRNQGWKAGHQGRNVGNAGNDGNAGNQDENAGSNSVKQGIGVGKTKVRVSEYFCNGLFTKIDL